MADEGVSFRKFVAVPTPTTCVEVLHGALTAMNRQQLALFLSGFGIFVFGCEAGQTSEVHENAASDLSGPDQFLMAQMLAKLPPKAANAVREALSASPGPKSEHALIQLFGAPKMISLSKAQNEFGCTPEGATAVAMIADWAKTSAGPRNAENDERQAKYLDALRAKLPKIDASNPDSALEALSCADDACKDRLFDAPVCDPDQSSTANNDCTDTSCALNDAPNLLDHERAQAAETKLASIFRELDTVRPSRGMESEWNVLRDRYRAGLGHAARDAILGARRNGSATLGRDASAQRRFDEGGRMVDAFVRGNVAFNVDAMNLIHAAVATEHQGHIRTAGQEAFHGRGTHRAYLPGAAVTRATENVFAAVRERRSESAPLVAAMFDQRMISIHPYMDANGRTTRLMTDWLLAREGFPPALATNAAPSSVLLWENPRVARDAHLEHITEGMRHAVQLVEMVG
jgi:hypothetical protein